MKEQLSKPSEEIRRAAGENVTSAQAVAVPSSPDPKVFIGISLLIGFVVAGGLALFDPNREWTSGIPPVRSVFPLFNV